MKVIRATEYINLFTKGEYVQAVRHKSQIPCPKCVNNSGFITSYDPNGQSSSRRCRCQGIDQRIKVFTKEVLSKADKFATKFIEREHLANYIYNNKNTFRIFH